MAIRNGVLYRDDGARTGLAMYRDGRMEVYDERTATGAALLAAGVWNTLSFGPALVDGGEIVQGIDKGEVDNNFGLRSIQGNNPRTGWASSAPTTSSSSSSTVGAAATAAA
jgi:exopolysaccharide biosynthesis protein